MNQMNQDPNQTIEGPDITNYWQYFNLDRDPFAMNATDALVYLSSYWEETLDLIQYLVNYKNQMIVITGASGLGKSTLNDLLFEQLAESVNTSKINAEASLDVTRFVEFISDAFTLPWHPEQSIEQTLDEQLQAFQSKERPCLLVIDNAHLLPTETLEALLYLVGQQSEHQMRFHVLLIGEPTLQQTFQRLMEPAEENLVHFITLEALSLAETQLYLNHRLSASGWQGETPMTDEIVARIYRLSEGNPARINRIARRVLLDMLTQQNTPSNANWWQRYGTKTLGAILVVFLLLVVALWFMRTTPSTATAPTGAAPSISVNGKLLDQGQAVELPAPAATPAANAPATTPVPSVNTAQLAVAPGAAVNAPAAPIVPTNSEPQKVSVSDAAPTAAPAVAAPVTPTPAVAPAANPAPLAPVTNSVPVAAAAPAASNVVANSAQVTTTNVAPAMGPIVDAPEAAKQIAANEPAATDNSAKAKASSDQVPASVKAATKTKSARVKTSDAPKQAAAVVKQSGDYTIQLLSLTRDDNVASFIKKNKLSGKVFTKKEIHNGKTVTVVLYGRYKTMRDAEQAITTLPDSLQNAGPWPRKIPK